MKGWIIWSKLIPLVALAGILYWRDLTALAETMSSLEQAGFTVVIASFILFSTYQKREALKTLASLSETRSIYGVFLLVIAICILVFGSYTARPLWLHHASLLAFITGYLALRIDYRVPRMIIATLFVSLFLLPLPVEVKILDNLSISPLVTFLIITLFLSQSFDILVRWKAVAASVGMIVFVALSRTGAELASTFSPLIGASLIVVSCVGLPRLVGGKTIKIVEPCPLCRSGRVEEAFCPHCGKRLAPGEPKNEKHFFLKLAGLSIAVILVSFAAIPVLSLENGKIIIKSFGSWGTEEQSALPTPQGWAPYSSERLGALEKEYGEELVLKNIYVEVEHPEREAYTLYLEMGTVEPRIAVWWRYMPGWNKTRPQNSTISFAGAPPGEYMVLQKRDEAMVVVIWSARAVLMAGPGFSEKRVGASMVMNLTANPSQKAISETAERMRGTFEPTARLWAFVDRWTDYARTAKEMYGKFTPLTISLAGLGAVVAMALKAKQNDSKVQRRVDGAMLLPREDKLLVSTIVEATKQRISPTGRNISDLYEQKIKSAIGRGRFYEKLNRLVNEGIVRKELSMRGSEVIMEWKLNI